MFVYLFRLDAALELSHRVYVRALRISSAAPTTSVQLHRVVGHVFKIRYAVELQFRVIVLGHLTYSAAFKTILQAYHRVRHPLAVIHQVSCKFSSAPDIFSIAIQCQYL